MSPINGRLLYYKFITREHLPIMNFLSSRDLFVSGNLRHRLILVESLIKKPRHSAKMRPFSHPYFPVFVQNCICIFPYMDKLEDSVHIQETLDTILSIYEKMPITKSWHLKLYYTCNYITDQNL